MGLQKCKALHAVQEAWGTNMTHNTLEFYKYVKDGPPKKALQEEFPIAVATRFQERKIVSHMRTCLQRLPDLSGQIRNSSGPQRNASASIAAKMMTPTEHEVLGQVVLERYKKKVRKFNVRNSKALTLPPVR